MNIDPEDFGFNCHECGEFDCEIDHDSVSDFDYDDDWMFDGSGMVGDC